ncbi:MAG TPA: SulP family inorganic anion transporter [Clostridia bacterium]
MKLKNYFSSLLPQSFLLKRHYQKQNLFQDIFAGVFVGIIAIPLSIAFAASSGVPPIIGLTSAFFAGIVAAVFSGCRYQITGPTGACILILNQTLRDVGFEGMLICTFLAGMLVLLMGLLKLGKYSKYIARPVVVGFSAGLALSILTSQVPDYLALKLSGLPLNALEKWMTYFENWQSINITSVVLGSISVALLIVWKKLNIKFPAPMAVIIIISIITTLFKLNVPTLGSKYGSLTMEIDFKLQFSNFEFFKIIKPTIYIAILIAIVSLLSAMTADNLSGQKTNMDAELVSQGLANIICACFGCIPVMGAVARTSSNISSGSVSFISSIVHSLVILITGLFLMPLASYIPLTVLAAVLFVACFNMFNIKAVKKVFSYSIKDIIIFFSAFVLTFLVNIIVAIAVSIIMSFLFLIIENIIKKTKHIKSPLEIKIIDQTIYFSGDLNFVTVQKIFNIVLPKTDTLIIDLQGITTFDMTGCEVLENWIKSQKSKFCDII